ncbi:unnamed protein product [Dicrocoelium dendriticum]|nr:unnamed protein product [Dicrocoelium dendriticum]
MGSFDLQKPNRKPKARPLVFFNEEKLKIKKVLFASELQKLLGLVFLPQHFVAWPDWCIVRRPNLIKCVIVLFCNRVNSVCLSETDVTPFNKSLCFFSPSAYHYSWEEELFNVPRLHLSSHALDMVDKHQSVKLPSKKRQWVSGASIQAISTELKNLTRCSNSICSSDKPDCPVRTSTTRTAKKTEKRKLSPHRPFSMPAPGSPDAFDRTLLLMNLEQMLYERVPVPEELCRGSKIVTPTPDYVPSKPFYRPVSSSSPMFAIDCEMVVTKSGNELARVTLVDETNFVIFDRLVKPENPVEDYVTKFSGITRDMLAPVTTRVADIQKELDELLPPDAILVGHSISNDLHALKIYHPYLIDTSVIYNLKGARTSKARLRFLSEHFLGRLIQTGSSGHSSAEDAIATMDLTRLKLSQGLSFGDVTTSWRFPENYNAALFARQAKRVNTVVQSEDKKSDFASSTGNTTEPCAYNRLQPDRVDPAFRPTVAELRSNYFLSGPPVHLINRLLHDCDIPVSCWPILETAEFNSPNDNPQGQDKLTTDQLCGRNQVSKRMSQWLLQLASHNRLVIAEANCPLEWGESKCNNKICKLCQRLRRGLPAYSLVVVVCTGDSPSSSIGSVRAASHSGAITSSPPPSPENMKRCVYITLTEPETQAAV